MKDISLIYLFCVLRVRTGDCSLLGCTDTYFISPYAIMMLNPLVKVYFEVSPDQAIPLMPSNYLPNIIICIIK